jgi:hypothetical protein
VAVDGGGNRDPALGRGASGAGGFAFGSGMQARDDRLPPQALMVINTMTFALPFWTERSGRIAGRVRLETMRCPALRFDYRGGEAIADPVWVALELG